MKFRRGRGVAHGGAPDKVETGAIQRLGEERLPVAVPRQQPDRHGARQHGFDFILLALPFHRVAVLQYAQHDRLARNLFQPLALLREQFSDAIGRRARG
jgi:hypothetical protein